MGVKKRFGDVRVQPQPEKGALCAVSPMEPASLNLPFGAQTAGGVLRPTKKKEMAFEEARSAPPPPPPPPHWNTLAMFAGLLHPLCGCSEAGRWEYTKTRPIGYCYGQELEWDRAGPRWRKRTSTCGCMQIGVLRLLACRHRAPGVGTRTQRRRPLE